MSTASPQTPASAPVDSARAAIGSGWRRVGACWRDVAAAYLLSLLLALPLAAALRASLADSLRHREAAENLLRSWDGLWHATVSSRAEGLERTFDAGIVGIGAVLRSLDVLVRGALLDLPGPILVVGLSYLAGWVLLSGGLLARFRGDEGGVLRLGARWLGRMLSVALVGWGAWVLVLGVVLPSLGLWVDELCREVIDERIHLAWVLAKYVVVWGLVLAIRVWIDVAKVLAIEEPTMPTAAVLGRALTLCRRRAGSLAGVVVQLGLVWLGVVLAYWVVAPGADQANPLTILVAFLISQASVLARVGLRAWGLASIQALVRGTKGA